MDIGLGFFSSISDRRHPFQLFADASILADKMGLSSVWVPERHYHSFGGAFPCPAVAAGALAASTDRIAIRAGSLVSPLHDPIEVAEQWAMVHALSQGRAGVAFASGWQSKDFVTRPANYAGRKELVWEQIEEVRALWRGESVERVGSDGALTQISIYPKVELPLPGVWVTTTGDSDTVRRAGVAGFGLFTHLVNQSVVGLKKTIAVYRDALPMGARGHVALMIHTYLSETDVTARTEAQGPLNSYLKQFLNLRFSPPDSDCETMISSQLECGVRRYFDGHSLIGSYETCLSVLDKLAAIGVDEVACLIDFGLDDCRVMRSLERLAALREAQPV